MKFDFLTKVRKRLGLKKSNSGSSKVPFEFEIHGDSFSINVHSELDKSLVFDLFFKGLKKLKVKSVLVEEDMPKFFNADSQQLKALESLVVNKKFIEDVVKQVKKDIPTFKILSQSLNALSWEQISVDKYKQSIVISGICYYEE